MEAVEAGTGKVFTWSIVTMGGFLSRKAQQDHQRDDAPWWLDLMRKLFIAPVNHGHAKPSE